MRSRRYVGDRGGIVEHLLVRLELFLGSNRVPCGGRSVGTPDPTVIRDRFPFLLRRLLQAFDGVEMCCD